MTCGGSCVRKETSLVNRCGGKVVEGWCAPAVWDSCRAERALDDAKQDPSPRITGDPKPFIGLRHLNRISELGEEI